MIKIYCEDGSMTKAIKNLKKDSDIELVSFPFENINKRTTDSKRPSELTCDSTFVTGDSDIRISDTVASELFAEIEEIVGKGNYNDIRHIDTAYKEKCQIFVSPDKKDIVNNGRKLFELTGIKFFYCDDIQGINKYIKQIKQNPVRKILNYSWIGITTLLVFLISRFFFLGSEDDFEFLKADLVSSLLNRTVSVMVFGIVSIMILVLINYLMIKDWKTSIRIGLIGIAICLVSSLIGTTMFFYN